MMMMIMIVYLLIQQRIGEESGSVVNFHQGDIFEKNVNNYIKSFFENNKVDLILSDMSPNSSGNKQIDHLRIISLIENVLELCDHILESDGHLVVKIFHL